jgi:heat shock protein HslJ
VDRSASTPPTSAGAWSAAAAGAGPRQPQPPCSSSWLRSRRARGVLTRSGRRTAPENRADLQTTPHADEYIEFRADGTLGGNDGCTGFGGHWRLEGAQLVVGALASDGIDCAPAFERTLRRVLETKPTVTPASRAGTIVLMSPAGTVVLGGRDNQIESELMADELDGVVKVTFHTPRSLASGSQRTLATWTAATSVEPAISAWVQIAIDGLPDDCRLESIPRWEELSADIATGSWDTTPRWDHRRGESTGDRAIRRDVPASCAGSYTMVLLLSTDFVAAHIVTERVPITIG